MYALLRETLKKAGKAGIARVVIQTRQHLAVLMPSGPALVLNLLRWSADIRSYSTLDIPKDGVKGAGLNAQELKMAEQLVASMSGEFKPEEFTDSFKTQVLSLVARKAKAGKTHAVIEPEEATPASGGADIIDLTELLKRSLKGDKSPAKPAGRTRATGRKRHAA